MCAEGQGTTHLPPLLGHDPMLCVPRVGFGLSHVMENFSLLLPIELVQVGSCDHVLVITMWRPHGLHQMINSQKSIIIDYETTSK